MRLLDLIHRWAGGLIGLVLAVIAFSGTLLLWRNSWVWLPHVGDAQRQDVASLAAQAEALSGEGARTILFASRDFGLTQGYLAGEAGLYVDQSGAPVARWSSLWERPELFLFDLHHHLLAGETGETVTAIAGVAGLLFILTGVVLWWRTRRTFRLRFWPKRMSRPAIVTHHRDLGIVMAPLLLLTIGTGTMILIKPLANFVLAPTSPGVVAASLKAPKLTAGAMPDRVDWQAIVATAQARFPGAELRVISLPRKPGDPVSIRMRQQAEWLPNGRTYLWFDPATARVIETRDSLALPAGAQRFNALYPIHAAKVGGVVWKAISTLTGLTLLMLGSFAVWTFWFRGGRRAAGSGGAAQRTNRTDRGGHGEIDGATVTP